MSLGPDPHRASMSPTGMAVEFDAHTALSSVAFDVYVGTLAVAAGTNVAGKATQSDGIAGLPQVHPGKRCLPRMDQGSGAAAFAPERASTGGPLSP